MKIPESISLTRDGQYCLTCFNETIERYFDGGRTFYTCSSCDAVDARSLVIDKKITAWVDEDGTYWHESVGVIIENGAGQIFCILRTLYPFAYAVPAGHLDTGENADGAAQREVQEEIGILLPDLKFLGRFPIRGDQCRRGCDDHMWNLFTAKQPSDFKPKLSDEASRWVWMSKEEIMSRHDMAFPMQYLMNNYLN
ncbi:MAG: NUDIX hydrolase [Patescibacteria group bacterium]